MPERTITSLQPQAADHPSTPKNNTNTGNAVQRLRELVEKNGVAVDALTEKLGGYVYDNSPATNSEKEETQAGCAFSMDLNIIAGKWQSAEPGLPIEEYPRAQHQAKSAVKSASTHNAGGHSTGHAVRSIQGAMADYRPLVQGG